MKDIDYTQFVPKEDSWLKKRNNGMILTDYHISVLNKNGINYENYGSVKEILFAINDILEIDEDEELELVAREIDERNYYQSKKN